MTLTNEHVRRYARHLVLSEVGASGQEKLLNSKVLVVGLGGLGSPIAIYLAAAGVGTLGLADFDLVDLSNLQRQVIHQLSHVGMPKTESAGKRIASLNPGVKVNIYHEKISAGNAEPILKNYDVIVDGCDNFETRFLVNGACVSLGKPYVYGSVLKFNGQASVFKSPEGPCYRCLYPEEPPAGSVPTGTEAGIMGILPGVIGTIQAAETIKLILGKGRGLAGRLLMFNAMTMKFREARIEKDPDCPACGRRKK